MEETSNNFLNKKTIVFFLVIVIIILLAFFGWKKFLIKDSLEYNQDTQSTTWMENPGLLDEIEQLKSQQEEVLFESKTSAPSTLPQGFPVDRNPVEIYTSKAYRSFPPGGEEFVFTSYAYFSLISIQRSLSDLENYLTNNNYNIEKTVEDSFSSISATKENEEFLITLAETDGGLTYVTISLTTQ